MYKIILAFRYFYKRRISYLAIAAVALCVFIVIVVMTIMAGLVRDFKDKNHDFTGDCVVGTESLVGFPYYEDFIGILRASDFIESVSPVIDSYALVGVEGSENNVGLQIIGIESASYAGATAFGRTLHYHKDDAAKAFELKDDANLVGCVIGVDLWLQRNSKGQYYYRPVPDAEPMTVTCFPLTAKGALAKAGTGLVNSRTFYISDFAESGLAQIDSSVIYVPFEDAQILCGMKEPIPRTSRIHIKFGHNVTLEAGCEKVRLLWNQFYKQVKDKPDAALLEGVNVKSWKQHRREFIAAMEKEQVMLMAMFGLVGLTTVFIVFVIFYMIVSHKSKDIGILKSIGASGYNVMALFLFFACIIGFSGSILGIAAGIWFLRDINTIEAWLFERFGFQLWDRTIYAIGQIPNQVDLTLVAVVAGCAILACVAGAALPSMRASRAKPVETLQVSQL